MDLGTIRMQVEVSMSNKFRLVEMGLSITSKTIGDVDLVLIMVKELSTRHLGWDEKFLEDLDEKARGILINMVTTMAIKCPRAPLEEDNNFNSLLLVGFPDNEDLVPTALFHLKPK